MLLNDLRKPASFGALVVLLGFTGCSGNKFSNAHPNTPLAAAAPEAPASIPTAPPSVASPAAAAPTASPTQIVTATPTPAPRADDAEIVNRITQSAAGTGVIQVSLTWNSGADLDFHMLTPLGEHVYFDNRNDGSGGFLDVDRNANGPESRTPIENYFISSPQNAHGHYKIYVHYYEPWDAPASQAFKVRLMLGDVIQVMEGNAVYNGSGSGGTGRRGAQLPASAVLVKEFDF